MSRSTGLSDSNVAAAHASLAEFYRAEGLSDDVWHVGAEHPSLENAALEILEEMTSCRILEVGVQSGGFAVPVVLAVAARRAFAYSGIDNLQFTNAVPLRLIESFLRHSGVTGPLRFVEGDSTTELFRATPDSYDLILLDHYKPKYPLDLYLVFSRKLLSRGGIVLLHDVLTHAAPDWKICQQVCEAFGYVWTVRADVSQGLAIVRYAGPPAGRLQQTLVGMRVTARWRAHEAVLGLRRTAARTLRRLGLRH